MENKVKTWMERIPEFCLSHWLLRIPLAVVFIQQGIAKIPVTVDDAQSFEDELKRILIHGSLHLCGYDDQTPQDKSEMTSLEENYLEKFIKNILIG